MKINKYILLFMAAFVVESVWAQCKSAPVPVTATFSLSTKNLYPEGIVNKKAVFSVNSAGGKVLFSKGNLRFHITNAESRKCIDETYKSGYFYFADQQYLIIGKSQYTTQNNSDIDFFMYGTSGYSAAPTSDYMVQYNLFNDEKGGLDNNDWGYYNPIKNGTNEPAIWRVLKKEEWQYILSGRGSNMYGLARIRLSNEYYGYPLDYVYGWVLLPDNWVIPSGLTFTAGISGSPDYSDNQYTTTEWAKMEENGAVFLPTSGSRSSGNSVNMDRVAGHYWSSSWIIGDGGWGSQTGAFYLNMYYSGVGISVAENAIGYQVRLVHDL